MRERLSAAAYTVAWSTVRNSPEWLPRRAFGLLAEASYRRRGRWVRRFQANLRRVIGADADDAALDRLTRQAVQSYLRYWMEVFRLPVMSREQIVDGHDWDGVDRVRAAYDSGRGVVLALPHMGNWDAAGAWCVHRDLPFTTVAERLKPESLFDRFVEFRESLGMEVLPLTGGAMGPYPQLRARLEAGGMLALLADRDLTASGVEIQFFGAAARMPAGPAALTLDTGAALIPVTLWYPPDNAPGWCGRFHPEIAVPADGTRAERVTVMTQALADVFETAIAAHPADWHMVQKLWVADLDPAQDVLRTRSAELPGAVA